MVRTCDNAYPGGTSKVSLCMKWVTGMKLPRGWNSTGPPRASTTATPKMDPLILDCTAGVSMLREQLCALSEHPNIS